jgi:hypothetical protein
LLIELFVCLQPALQHRLEMSNAYGSGKLETDEKWNSKG